MCVYVFSFCLNLMLPPSSLFFFFLMIRRPPRSTLDRSSAASDVYKRQDDINAQIDQTQKQLKILADQKKAHLSILQTQTSSISGDLLPLYVQIEQLSDQLKKCVITNPVNCILYTSPSPRHRPRYRRPSSA